MEERNLCICGHAFASLDRNHQWLAVFESGQTGESKSSSAAFEKAGAWPWPDFLGRSAELMGTMTAMQDWPASSNPSRSALWARGVVSRLCNSLGLPRG